MLLSREKTPGGKGGTSACVLNPAKTGSEPKFSDDSLDNALAEDLLALIVDISIAEDKEGRRARCPYSLRFCYSQTERQTLFFCTAFLKL